MASIVSLRDGTILDVNPAAVACYGYSREELVGMPAMNLTAPEVRPYVAERLQTAFRESARYLGLHVRKDGARFPVELSVRALEIDGAPAIFTLGRDVTEKHRIETEARQLRQRLELAVELAGLGIWDWNPRTDVATWNDRMCAIYGIKREEFTRRGADYIGFTRADYRERQIANIAQAFERGVTEDELSSGRKPTPNPQELCLVWPDGSEHYTLGDAIPIVDRDGRPARMVGVTLDITASKRAEQVLQESEARFRAMFDSAPLAILLSRDDRVLMANRASAQLVGCADPSELEGRPLVELVAPEAREVVLARHRARFTGEGAPLEYESTGLRRDGSRFPFLVNVALVRLPDGPATLAFFRDLTERERAREEREQVEHQLRQSQKVEAVGRLAGGVAHEFNNLLTPILGNCEMVLDRLPPTSQERDLIQDVYGCAERARDLVQHLLTFSRRHEPRRLRADLVAIARDGLKLLRAALPVSIHLSFEAERAAVPVLVDAHQVQQVLTNLVTNAAHAIGRAQGEIEVRVGSVELSAARAQGRAPGRFAELAVRDTGSGMSAEVQARIFEPFFTTKRVGEGTGLGLAVVYGIVSSHGGLIEVESDLGVGTVFRVLLPEHVAAAEPGA